MTDLKNYIDAFATTIFGVSKSEATSRGICVRCKDRVSIEDFRDTISLSEYTISQLCQDCQDEVFDV